MTAESASPPVISFKECRDEEIAGFFANEGKTFHPLLPSCQEAAQSRVIGAPHFQVKKSLKDKLRSELRATARFVSAGTAPSIQICSSTLADNIGGENSSPFALSKPALSKPALSKPALTKPVLPKSALPKPAAVSGTFALGALLACSGSSRQRSRAAKVVCDPLEDKPVMRLSPAQKAAVQKTIADSADSNVNKAILLRNKPVKKTEKKILQLHTAVSSETESASELLPEKSIQENGVQLSVQESLLEQMETADEQLRTLICSWSKLPDRFKETIRALVEVSSKNSDEQSPAKN